MVAGAVGAAAAEDAAADVDALGVVGAGGAGGGAGNSAAEAERVLVAWDSAVKAELVDSVALAESVFVGGVGSDVLAGNSVCGAERLLGSVWV
jgi:hypothetical protein